MKNYVGKKFLTMLITILLVSLLSFTAFSLISGNAATSMLGTQATPARIAALEKEYGLDKPVIVQYFYWLKNLFHGSLGISYSYHVPVTEVLSGKLSVTLTLTGISFLMIILLAFPLGVSSAMHVGSLRDRVMQVVSQIFMSVPPFFLGMVLTLVFGLTLHFFVPGGYVSFGESAGGFFAYLICPALSIALPRSAMAGRFLRNSLIVEKDREYVRTAYSRGSNSRSIFYRHMLRNAMIPVLTFLAVIIPEIVTGSIIVEQVFSIPGIGRILLSSISNRDYPVVQAIILMLTFLVTFMNFLADVLYHKLDTRVDTI